MVKRMIIMVLCGVSVLISGMNVSAMMGGGSSTGGGFPGTMGEGESQEQYHEEMDGYFGQETPGQHLMTGNTEIINGMISLMGIDPDNTNTMGNSSFMSIDGNHHYEFFGVDVTMDIFTNHEAFEAFMGLEFMDENDDGVADMFQNSYVYHSMGFGAWMDQNEDGVGDMFQTFEMYKYMGMNNFVDINGDGISDNYSQGIASNGMNNSGSSGGVHYYGAFTVDIKEDVFTNPESFMLQTGLEFIDENNDGIADMFQNSELYHAMGFGDWMDLNNDSIGDLFQTRGMYNLFGMNNFVDINSDGLCDNYGPNLPDVN